MKIYTKTGDRGQTSLVGGKRVSKASTRLEAYGTVDELNSWIGVVASLDIPDCDTKSTLLGVQNRLFDLGAYLATDFASRPQGEAAHIKGIGQTQVERLEREIDRLDTILEPLHCFVLPGGCKASGLCNVARAVARRAERRIVALASETELSPLAIGYINRLSDYLFTLSRAFNRWNDTPEVPWTQGD